MDKLSIGEVAKRANIAASAIRYYESEGLIPPAGRVRGRRVYDPPIIARLALIHLAKSAGFTIAEIRKLLAGVARSAPPGARWRELAERKLAELEAPPPRGQPAAPGGGERAQAFLPDDRAPLEALGASLQRPRTRQAPGC